MKRISAATIVGIALASTPTLAADLFGTAAPPTMSVPASEAPTAVEVGSNWYIRGDLGAGVDSVPSLTFSSISAPAPGTGILPLASSVGSSRTDFSADIGFGYRFNNYFRADATYEYRTAPGGGNANSYVCPYGLVPEPTVQPVGFLYDPTNTCIGNFEIQSHNYTALANAYVDLGTYGPVTPYIGAGGGANLNVVSASVSYITSIGESSYNGALATTGNVPQVWVNRNGVAISPQPNIPFAQQVWDHSISSTKYTPAWALMAGVGIQISPSATLDIGYRYLNAGVTTIGVTSQVGSVFKQSNVSQQLRIGVRYTVD